MCLERVTENYDSPSTLIVDGWKEFGGSESKPTVQFAIKGNRVIPLDQWIEASDEHAKVIGSSAGGNYKPGFHAYSDEAKANWGGTRTMCRRVFLRRITCAGTQNGQKAVIAQEMYVPSERNGWPPLAVKGGK